ncbi:MAG: hypothetical protein QOE70_5336 [Chthoniobacter sp.]|nr:hypothetical protein [Chthoniobacter sp.]
MPNHVAALRETVGYAAVGLVIAVQFATSVRAEPSLFERTIEWCERDEIGALLMGPSPESNAQIKTYEEAKNLPPEYAVEALKILRLDGNQKRSEEPRAARRKIGAMCLLSSFLKWRRVSDPVRDEALTAVRQVLTETPLDHIHLGTLTGITFLGEHGTERDLDAVARFIGNPNEPTSYLAKRTFNDMRERLGLAPVGH